MARTTSARGKKPSQKRGKKPSHKPGRGTQDLPQPAPPLVTIDFTSNILNYEPFKEEFPQSVVFVVKTPLGPYPPTSDEMTFVRATGTPEMNVYVGMLTPSGKGFFPYKVFWSSTPVETKTANGSIDVTGGGDGKRLKGPRRKTARRRASGSTRR